MDVMTFIVEIMKALAWPVASIIIVVLIREPLLDLLPRLRVFKAMGAEFNFDKRKIGVVAARVVKAVETQSTTINAGKLPSAEMRERRHVALRALIPTLARIEKIIVMMYYFEEMPFGEIAEQLDMTEDQVRRMHQRVLARLKTAMEWAIGDTPGDPQES